VLVLCPSQTRRVASDRYEPLPGFTQLPGWVWQRMGRGVRIGGALLILALIAAGAALLPGIQESKDERARSEAQQRTATRAELARRIEREQRPRFARSAPAPAGAGPQERLAARAALMRELPLAALADARARVRSGALDGPVLRVECEPFPRSIDGVGADADLSLRRGLYSCIAVTAEFKRSEQSIGGVVGHQYRALVDFESGRYAFCKVSGQAGPSREQLATTPHACGG
jgi:hypothetical protein